MKDIEDYLTGGHVGILLHWYVSGVLAKQLKHSCILFVIK